MPVKSLTARQIFDSLGVPTVEVDLITDIGLFRASVPSSDKTGSQYECKELRDGVKNEYKGMGVLKVVETINDEIAPEFVHQRFEPTEQEAIDNFLIELDGTPDKSNLGVNSILGISMACAKAGAAKRGLPLYRHIADLTGNKEIVIPVPVFNAINGGSFSGNKVPIQEILMFPVGATSFKQAMQMGMEVYQQLKAAIEKKFGVDSTAAIHVGGFSPTKLKKSQDALKYVKDAITKSKYGGRVKIGIDAAAQDMFKKGKYDMDFKNKKSKKQIPAAKLMKEYQTLIKKFELVSIEDPFAAEDWKSWTDITDNTDLQIVADVLTAVNPSRIEQACQKEACNCLLIKLNQIGTITEAIKAHLLAKANSWGTMVSHRAGDTEDVFIADFAVGLCCGQIKAGAPCRSESLSKYNQILRIEEELGSEARYAGLAYRNPI